MNEDQGFITITPEGADEIEQASPDVLVRLFGADTLWEEGAHPCSCR